MNGPQRRDRSWPTLLGTAVLAALFTLAHPSVFSAGIHHMPGIGLAVSTWALIGLGVFFLGTVHLRRSLPFLLCTALLSATYAIFGNDRLRLMNLPVTIALVALSFDALAGRVPPTDSAALVNLLRRLFLGVPAQLGAPFRMIRDARCFRDRHVLRALLQGILLCVPVAAVVLLLLCSADSIFAQAVGRLFGALVRFDSGLRVWQLLCFLFATLFLFSMISSALHWQPKKAAEPRRALSELSLGMLLALLSLIYCAFLFLQWTQTALPASAADASVQARSGFFQLVLVAVITLMVVLPTLSTHGSSRGLRALCALAALLTLGLLASALWRMFLYIRGYGWTLLRAVTLWGILAIAVALLAALCKCLRPSCRICNFLTVFTLISWILFNYANVDARIAQANVSAFQRGTLPELDTQYLGELSPDVLPALKALEGTDVSNEALSLEQRFALDRPCWYDWSLSWRRIDAGAQSALLGRWELASVDGEDTFSPRFDVWSCLEFNLDRTALFSDATGAKTQPFTWTLSGDLIQGAGTHSYVYGLLHNPSFSFKGDALEMTFQYGDNIFEYRRASDVPQNVG